MTDYLTSHASFYKVDDRAKCRTWINHQFDRQKFRLRLMKLYPYNLLDDDIQCLSLDCFDTLLA